MNRYQIAAGISILGLGLSIPALAADTPKPGSEAPSTQSGQPDTTTGQGQTGQTDAVQSDSAIPKSDQPATQAGQTQSTTGQGQTGQDQPQAGSSSASGQSPITVQLQPKGNSGVSGTATLTPKGNQTQVVVQLKGNISNVAQPAHFHSGTCDKLDPKPKFPLADVVNGTSSSVVSASVSELTSGQYTINVHKSAAEVKTSVACGNVKS